MCRGTFLRRGAVASATIYPCAECASSRSVFYHMEMKFSYDKKGLTPDKYCRSASPVSAQSQILFVIYDFALVFYKSLYLKGFLFVFSKSF